MMKIMTSGSFLRFTLLLVFMVPLSLAGSGKALAVDETAWNDIRSQLFGEDRTIHDGRDVIAIEAPDRALDAAIVPVSIEARMDQTDERYIEKIILVIDENPAPVAATFHLSPRNGLADISTRVRINAYTTVRAIAETNDGQLYMADTFVKASGGCAAPATKDSELAMSRLGQMRMKQIGAWEKGEPAEIQFMVSHPNYSGLQTDQLTQLWIPAHYVTDVELTLDGEPILSIEGDISLSENPTVRFFVEPEGDGELEARVVDSKGNTFTESWPIRMGPSS